MTKDTPRLSKGQMAAAAYAWTLPVLKPLDFGGGQGMNASVLLALAERCERACGPDRDLDAQISLAVGGYSETKSRYQPEPFTASLDAVMSLVPERCIFGCGSKDATYRSWAWVGPDEPPNGSEEIAAGATPALALAAAALRARAASAMSASGQDPLAGLEAKPASAVAAEGGQAPKGQQP